MSLGVIKPKNNPLATATRKDARKTFRAERKAIKAGSGTRREKRLARHEARSRQLSSLSDVGSNRQQARRKKRLKRVGRRIGQIQGNIAKRGRTATGTGPTATGSTATGSGPALPRTLGRR